MRKQVAPVLLAPTLIAAQSAPPPPAPPVVFQSVPTDALARREPELVTWTVGPILCAGKPVTPTLPPRPLAGLVPIPARAGGSVVRLSFTIDASGRPGGIEAPGGFMPLDTSDLGPSLAASRFAPGQARPDCAAWFTPTRTPIAQADKTAVMGFTVFPTSRPIRAMLERVKPVGSDCFEPEPALLNRAFPDFKKIPQEPGALDWSMVGFDIDADGQPVNARTVAGSGHAVLDREAVAAVQRSRYEAGTRKGCLYPYWRRGANLAAPGAPETKGFQAEGATCPAKTEWERPPVYAFPDGYRRRHIEGWAIVAYDVAPWGEIGNARVLAAQPAAAFGQNALSVLRGAKKKPSASGYSGCVDRVRFVVGARPEGLSPNRIDVTPPDTL